MGETWWEYLTRVTDRAAQVEIAKAAGVDPASVSRWKLGKNTPSADRVIAVARHFGRNPVEALVVAGYLDAAEVDASIELAASAADLTNDELVAAIKDRLDGARVSPGVLAESDVLDEAELPARETVDADAPPALHHLDAARVVDGH